MNVARTGLAQSRGAAQKKASTHDFLWDDWHLKHDGARIMESYLRSRTGQDRISSWPRGKCSSGGA